MPSASVTFIRQKGAQISHDTMICKGWTSKCITGNVQRTNMGNKVMINNYYNNNYQKRDRNLYYSIFSGPTSNIFEPEWVATLLIEEAPKRPETSLLEVRKMDSIQIKILAFVIQRGVYKILFLSRHYYKFKTNLI